MASLSSNVKPHPIITRTDFFLAETFEDLAFSGSRSRGPEIDGRSIMCTKIVASIEVSCLLVTIVVSDYFPVCFESVRAVSRNCCYNTATARQDFAA